MTDSAGPPISVIVSAANEHDVNFILPLVFKKFPHVSGDKGRPRTKPEVVRTDAGYTSQDALDVLASADIRGEIPQRGQTQTESLGRKRWPIERVVACLRQFRQSWRQTGSSRWSLQSIRRSGPVS